MVVKPSGIRRQAQVGMVDHPGYLGNKLMLPGGFPWEIHGRSSAALGHHVVVYYVQTENCHWHFHVC